jgi:tRNA nucleotidyltransferase/poly(A) polymerase
MPANSQREHALDIVRQLRNAGFEALWAGGCVRDSLLGREPKDYDVATNARPEEVQNLFGKRRTLAIGAAFGVIGVLNKENELVEVATFRSDGAYLDGRRPMSVDFTTAEQDAQRRDFTINGMFFDPMEDRVIDYVGGQADLQARIVRAIGDPTARFTEDKLRMLRAIRFATTYRFAIEPTTLAAIQMMAADVNVVSAERINAELTRLLVHPSRGHGLQLLNKSGLLNALIPELAEDASKHTEVWNNTLQFFELLDSTNVATALAALFIALPYSPVAKVGRRFRYSNKEIDLAVWLTEQLPHVRDAEKLPWPQMQRILTNEHTGELLNLARAVYGMQHSGILRCREYLALPIEKLNPAPLLTGDDLVRHGYRPGPHFAALLTAIRDAQLEGQIENESQAIELAQKLINTREIHHKDTKDTKN